MVRNTLTHSTVQNSHSVRCHPTDVRSHRNSWLAVSCFAPNFWLNTNGSPWGGKPTFKTWNFFWGFDSFSMSPRLGKNIRSRLPDTPPLFPDTPDNFFKNSPSYGVHYTAVFCSHLIRKPREAETFLLTHIFLENALGIPHQPSSCNSMLLLWNYPFSFIYLTTAKQKLKQCSRDIFLKPNPTVVGAESTHRAVGDNHREPLCISANLWFKFSRAKKWPVQWLALHPP